MRTIMAAGPAANDQSLPKGAPAWRLRTVVLVALLVAATLAIAWQSEAVRTWAEHAVRPSGLRGAAWTLIALYAVARLKEVFVSRAALLPILFAVVLLARLVSVGTVHIAEIAAIALISFALSARGRAAIAC